LLKDGKGDVRRGIRPGDLRPPGPLRLYLKGAQKNVEFDSIIKLNMTGVFYIL